MGAKVENRRVSTWRKLAGIVAASMLAVTVLGGTAQAAQPTWQVGHGTLYTSPTPSGASSSSVAAGKTAGFFEWLHNQTPSNISQLYMNATLTPSATLAGAEWVIKDSSEISVRSGICVPTASWLCSFGAVNSGQTVYVTLAYTIPSGVADGVSEALAASFNASGTPPGKNQSHGDVVSLSDSILISKNADASGDFNLDSITGLFTVFDNAPSGNNKQGTSASVNGAEAQVGISVGDSPNLSQVPCIAPAGGFPSWFSCSLLTSLTSYIEVGNGKTFNNPNGPGTPGIKAIVQFSNPVNQLTGDHPFSYHYWVDATGAHSEIITDTCFAGTINPDFPGNTAACITVINSRQVVTWLLHNGGMKY
jgi:hypothetical protein